MPPPPKYNLCSQIEDAEDEIYVDPGLDATTDHDSIADDVIAAHDFTAIASDSTAIASDSTANASDFTTAARDSSYAIDTSADSLLVLCQRWQATLYEFFFGIPPEVSDHFCYFDASEFKNKHRLQLSNMLMMPVSLFSERCEKCIRRHTGSLNGERQLR